jgi:hypothetical protein
MVGHLFDGGGKLLQGFTIALGSCLGRFKHDVTRCWSLYRAALAPGGLLVCSSFSGFR